jgi:hypothetical protein
MGLNLKNGYGNGGGTVVVSTPANTANNTAPAVATYGPAGATVASAGPGIVNSGPGALALYAGAAALVLLVWGRQSLPSGERRRFDHMVMTVVLVGVAARGISIDAKRVVSEGRANGITGLFARSAAVAL